MAAKAANTRIGLKTTGAARSRSDLGRGGPPEPFDKVAGLLLKYRRDHGLTQDALARRVGTSYSQISRIESGRHHVSLNTLARIAHALDLKLIVGFETTTLGNPEREVVAI